METDDLEPGTDYKFLLKYGLKELKDIPKEALTQELCDIAYNYSHNVFNKLPQEFITQEMCNEIIKEEISKENKWYPGYNIISFMQFKNIPKKLFNKRLCDELIKYSPACIDIIPNSFKTQKMCTDIATLCSGRSDLLKFIPKEFITNEIIALFNFNDISISGIPESLRTKYNCTMLINDNLKEGDLDLIPREFFDDAKFVKNIVGKHRWVIAHLIRATNVEITDELIEEALMGQGFVYYRYLCDDHKDQYLKIAKMLIERELKDPDDITIFTKSELAYDEDLLLFFLKNLENIYNFNFDDIEEDAKTTKVCMYLLDSDIRFFRDDKSIIERIPEDYLTNDLLLKIIDYDGKEFSSVPNKFKTQELCDKFFDLDIHNLMYIPKQFVTEAMFNKAIEKNISHSYYSYFPEEYMTESMYIEYFKSSGYYDANHAFSKIPVKFRSKSLCEFAISVSLLNLKFVPDEFITESFVMYAFTVVRDYCSRSQNKLDYESLKKISKFIDTNESIRNNALSRNVKTIKFIKDDLITHDMCLYVVSKDGMMLEFVPKRFKDEEIVALAIKRNSKAKEFK